MEQSKTWEQGRNFHLESCFCHSRLPAINKEIQILTRNLRNFLKKLSAWKNYRAQLLQNLFSRWIPYKFLLTFNNSFRQSLKPGIATHTFFFPCFNSYIEHCLYDIIAKLIKKQDIQSIMSFPGKSGSGWKLCPRILPNDA